MEWLHGCRGQGHLKKGRALCKELLQKDLEVDKTWKPGDVARRGSVGGKMVVRFLSLLRGVDSGMGNHWRIGKIILFTGCSVSWRLGAWREGSDGVPGFSK